MKLLSTFILAITLLTGSFLQVQGTDTDVSAKIVAAAAKEGLSGVKLIWMPDIADNQAWKFPGLDYEGKSELLPAEGEVPFAKFRRLTLNSTTETNWSHKLIFKVPQTFQVGQMAYLVFWTKAGNRESNDLPLIVQVTSRPDTSLVKADNFKVELTDTWQFHSIEISILSDVPENVLDIAILVGGEPRVLDIAGVAISR